MSDVTFNPLREGLQVERMPEPNAVVIFGASGDLTKRKLVPALYNLELEGLLPTAFAVIGFARRPIPDEEFRAQMLEGINLFSRNRPARPEVWQTFSEKLHYCAGNFDDPQAYQRLQTIPGIGKVLGLVLLYETHNISRFADVGNFVSYARLVRCSHESAGKKSLGKGNKIGNAHLKWAFSEASCLMIREVPQAARFVARKEKKHGKAKALSILAAKIGRGVYWMLKRKEAFDVNKFFAG